ncbi:hypothetical protein [Geitlerinema sp. PCC 9228]|nr:hypothetical protein [Geitlerinema sp. PCC 9228]
MSHHRWLLVAGPHRDRAPRRPVVVAPPFFGNMAEKILDSIFFE